MTKPAAIHVDPGAPYSQEAEEATLGSVILDPEQFPSIATFLKADAFFLLRHNYVWTAMERLYDRRDPIDYVTIAEELDNMGKLEQIGGRAYIIQLVNSMGTALHGEVYARLVERTAVRRKLMVAADEIKKLAQDEILNIASVLSEAQRQVMKISSSESHNGAISGYEAISKWYDNLDYKLQGQANGISYGVPSGFRDLDSLMGGWQRGDLVTIAGRPGMGKSSLKLCFAMNAARFGACIFFSTLEMPIDQFVTRMIAIESGVNVQKIRLAQLTPQEIALITNAVGRVSRWNFWLWEPGKMTIPQLQTEAQRIKYETGLDLLVVDYLQLVADHRAGKHSNRYQEVSNVARDMKDMARELNVPVVTGAQLSRKVENRGDKRPILSDLRESGEIEQISDVIAFLYRDDMYDEASEFPNQADIIVAKHRNGPTGTISLYFEKTLTKFMDASAHHIDLSDLE